MTDDATDTEARGERQEPVGEIKARKGRGPTRPIVKLGDLAEDVDKLDPAETAVLREAIECGTTAAELRAEAKARRKDAAGIMALAEDAAAALEARAALVERAEALTPALRRVLLAFMAGQEKA